MIKRTALMALTLVGALIAAPAYAWQVSPEEHAKHHPGAQADGKSQATTPPPAAKDAAGMGAMKGMNMAPNPKLAELVKKMNAATGQAKVDAIAELLTALVDDQQRMHSGMAGMMSMMQHPAK